jgi:REP element-mobilizing transposase RayT
MNKYNPNIHHRRSIRLKGYDNSQANLYFITICVKDRKCLFGNIEPSGNPRDCPTMTLTDSGKMIHDEWNKLPERFPNILLHEYVVMPNHFHAIIEIVRAALVVVKNQNPIDKNQNQVIQNEIKFNDNNKGRPQGDVPMGKTIGEMVGAFKSITTVEYIRGVKNNNWKPFDGKLWQRNYWEHIIMDVQSYHRISEYIINNPKNWNGDKFSR